MHDLSVLIRKLRLNQLIMSLASNWTTGSAAMGHFISHIVLDEVNFKLGCIPHHNTTHGIVDNFLQLTGVSNCVSRNWTLRAKATNSALANLTPLAERATLAHILMEYWFKATKEGRFGHLLAEMEQSGTTDFTGVEINDHALPDLGYLPGRTNPDKSIRCWKFCSKLYIVVSTRQFVCYCQTAQEGHPLGRRRVQRESHDR